MMESTRKLKELRELRDQIRVKMHLAGMEARQVWEELEPKFREIESWFERGGERASQMTSAFLEELSEAFRRIRDRMDRDEEETHPPAA